MPRRTLRIVLIAVLAAAALAVFRRRAIEPPADEGTWEPV
jgi:hypothetical protein